MRTLDKLQWASRGWTFQEHLLSWRTLTYSQNQMIWNCRKCFELEYGGFEDTQNLHIFSSMPNFHEYTNTLLQRLEAYPGGTLVDWRKYRGWCHIVTKYTSRTLIIASDRLPTIGGMAKIFHKLVRDDYCAGLWKDDMLFGLMWKYDVCGVAVNEQSFSSQFPSWSRVSFNNSLSFPYAASRGTNDFEYVELARVENVWIQYTSSIYGSVKSGEFLITGPCHTIRMAESKILEDVAQKYPTFDAILHRKINQDKEI